jgi:hypothetical protein
MKKLLILIFLLFNIICFAKPLSKERVVGLIKDFDKLLLKQGITNTQFRGELVNNLIRLVIIDNNNFSIKIPTLNLFFDKEDRFIYMSNDTNDFILINIKNPIDNSNVLQLVFKDKIDIKYNIKQYNKSFLSRLRIAPHFYLYEDKICQDFSFDLNFLSIWDLDFCVGSGIKGANLSLNYKIFNVGLKYLYVEKHFTFMLGFSLKIFNK